MNGQISSWRSRAPLKKYPRWWSQKTQV